MALSKEAFIALNSKDLNVKDAEKKDALHLIAQIAYANVTQQPVETIYIAVPVVVDFEGVKKPFDNLVLQLETCERTSREKLTCANLV